MDAKGIDTFEAIRTLLCQVPGAQINSVRYDEESLTQYGIDGLVFFTHAGANFSLAVHVKANGAPRYVRAGIYQLESYIARLQQVPKGNANVPIIPMILSQYLSPKSRSICTDHEVAYLDLFGNARLVFESVYIERAVADRPVTESRALRSLFTPKAAAILRVLLREPDRAWRVAELADEARASYGHVSNVRRALLEREWIEVESEGVVLVQPNSLLQEWRDSYHPPVCESISGYTTFQGSEFDQRLWDKLNPFPEHPRAIYSLHSAAQRLAPLDPSGIHTFYVNEKGAEVLYAALALTRNVEGPNVILSVVKDESPFLDAFEPSANVFCSSPTVTYLDLWAGNDHDKAAAENLAQTYFPWLN
ncbi:MAG: hypothetical protein OXG15_03150 [Gammaproteobacteria bacterium]|nr:hypothetical protein [Gammaproteobacteria bacterium]